MFEHLQSLPAGGGSTYCMEMLPDKNQAGLKIRCNVAIPLGEEMCATCKARKEKECDSIKPSQLR